ncbi:hypothetical protein [Lysobacter sp. GCM10012299]|uniref:hypothetical protein n=1 Tax=Lysobacter sp. GCM10012299 TaxID=3317333 RepID=UPI00361FC3B3
MKSPISRLVRNATPVNKDAARVAFFRGERFSPPSCGVGAATHTWRYPPDVVGVMPVWDRDWKGYRFGRMTALYWYRPGRGKGPSVWIARCDCGNYEARRPERWHSDVPTRWRGNDACAACRDVDFATGKALKTSRDTRKDRLNEWHQRMLRLGLDTAEVIAVMQAGDVDTAGKDADQIRAELAAREVVA